MPILGVIASSKLTAVAGDFESIATVTVGGGGSSVITFSSISSTYKHLQLRMLLRGDRAANTDDIKIQFNNDTGSNYADHILFGDGTVGVYNQNPFDMIYSYQGMPSANTTASTFYAGIMDILDYSSTVKYKTTRWFQGWDWNSNSTGAVELTSGLWRSTTAISTITVAPRYGSNFVQYSQIALYGIKG